MNDKRDKGLGFRIYRDMGGSSSKASTPSSALASVHTTSNHISDLGEHNKQMEVALLRKLHANTQVVGFLIYNKEIKGIRFYDYANKKFIDIAPWHLNQFNMSKLKLIGVREIELLRHEAGQSEGTVVLEFLTKHELDGYFRANRMIPNPLAEALSGILSYMSDEDYYKLLQSLKVDMTD